MAFCNNLQKLRFQESEVGKNRNSNKTLKYELKDLIKTVFNLGTAAKDTGMLYRNESFYLFI